jgi:hypothetical protein
MFYFGEKISMASNWKGEKEHKNGDEFNHHNERNIY